MEEIGTELVMKTFGPRCEKTCLRGFTNNKGADKPGHAHFLTSIFIIRLMESITYKLTVSKFSSS